MSQIKRVISRHLGLFAMLGLFFLGQREARSSAILGWDISGGSSVSLGGTPRANGAQFNISAPETVVGLGMWDEGSATLLNAHTVQLWTDSGTLLLSATVNNASTAFSSASGLGQWLITSTGPLVLSAGTYRIAVGYGVPGDDPVRIGTTVTSIGATFIQEAFSTGNDSTTAFPSNVLPFNQFAANLEFSTPEPSSLILLGAGIGAMVFIKRRQKV